MKRQKTISTTNIRKDKKGNIIFNENNKNQVLKRNKDKAGIKYNAIDAEENVELTKKMAVKKAPTLYEYMYFVLITKYL